MWLIVYVWCVEKGLKDLLNHCWYDIMFVLLCIVRCYENGHLLIICANMSLALFCDIVVTRVICTEKECELKEDLPFWGTYHAPWWILYFEGRVTHHNGYYISRDVSRVVMITIIEGRVVRHHRCMYRYVPHGSWTERQRVCISRSYMNHYTLHCIPLHCTYLSLVNLVSYFADLLIAFLRTCDWLILILLLRICDLFKYCS